MSNVVNPSIASPSVIQTRGYWDRFISNLSGLGQIGQVVMQAIQNQKLMETQHRQQQQQVMQQALMMPTDQGLAMLRSVGVDPKLEQYYLSLKGSRVADIQQPYDRDLAHRMFDPTPGAPTGTGASTDPNQRSTQQDRWSILQQVGVPQIFQMGTGEQGQNRHDAPSMSGPIAQSPSDATSIFTSQLLPPESRLASAQNIPRIFDVPS